MVLSFNVHSARTDAISAWSTGVQGAAPHPDGIGRRPGIHRLQVQQGDNLDRRLFIEQGFLLQRLRRRDFAGRSGGGAGGGKDRQCGGQQETQQCWPAFLPHGSKSFLRRLKPPGYGRKGPAGSLITVLLAGVLVHAAQKHLVAAELQQLAVLLLVEGDNAPAWYPPTCARAWRQPDFAPWKKAPFDVKSPSAL